MHSCNGRREGRRLLRSSIAHHIYLMNTRALGSLRIRIDLRAPKRWLEPYRKRNQAITKKRMRTLDLRPCCGIMPTLDEGERERETVRPLNSDDESVVFANEVWMQQHYATDSQAATPSLEA